MAVSALPRWQGQTEKREGAVNIGKAAEVSGLSAKMIRHYEAIGLLPRTVRSRSNYRNYNDADVQRMVFIRRAKALGFDLQSIKDLLRLWTEPRNVCLDVRSMAEKHLVKLESEAAGLQQMIDTLHDLVEICKRNEKSGCAIVSELSK